VRGYPCLSKGCIALNIFSKPRGVSMVDADFDILRTVVKRYWSSGPSSKAKRYVNTFLAAERRGTKITAKVVGNHGTYTVSIQGDKQGLTSTCSCYIGKYGHCHHCEALALTFLNDPTLFKTVKQTPSKEMQNLTDVRAYLESLTLDSLLNTQRPQSEGDPAESLGGEYWHEYAALISD